MKKVLLGGVVLITLGLVGSALAADMPMKAPVVVANTWTGFYIGGDAGGVRGLNSNDSFSQGGCNQGCFDPVVFNNTSNWGFSGGIFGGYNWQLSPSWVVGVEADWSKTSLSNAPGQLFLTNNGLPVPPCDIATAGSCHGLLMGNNLNWTATARARLGYTFGSTMVYATGGGAVASEELTGQVAAANFSSFSITTSSNHVSTGGWRAAAQFMATANWLLRIEYLHYVLNSNTATTIACTLCIPGAFSGPGNFVWGNSSLDVIRGGLSYKF